MPDGTPDRHSEIEGKLRIIVTVALILYVLWIVLQNVSTVGA